MWELETHVVVEELEEVLVGCSHTGEDRFFEKGAIEGAGGICIYEDFSFRGLGESAPWEFTPFTPLALSFFDLLLGGTGFFFKV